MAKKKEETLSVSLREELDDKMALYRRRLRRLESQIRHIPMAPSNADIAALLGMPKGSVDSGLFYLRNFLRTLEEARALPPGRTIRVLPWGPGGSVVLSSPQYP